MPTALATGQVQGQENPVNVVLSSKLYEKQSHLMLTSHIMNAQLIVINEKAWQALTPDQREQTQSRCRSTCQGDRNGASQEAEETEKLQAVSR